MIRVLYFAAAREPVGLDVEELDVRDASVASLRALLAQRHPALARVLQRSRLAVNQRFASDDDVVDDGSEVAIIPPVAGG